MLFLFSNIFCPLSTQSLLSTSQTYIYYDSLASSLNKKILVTWLFHSLSNQLIVQIFLSKKPPSYSSLMQTSCPRFHHFHMLICKLQCHLQNCWLYLSNFQLWLKNGSKKNPVYLDFYHSLYPFTFCSCTFLPLLPPTVKTSFLVPAWLLKTKSNLLVWRHFKSVIG